jgi:hypothetical protein
MKTLRMIRRLAGRALLTLACAMPAVLVANPAQASSYCDSLRNQAAVSLKDTYRWQSLAQGLDTPARKLAQQKTLESWDRNAVIVAQHNATCRGEAAIAAGPQCLKFAFRSVSSPGRVVILVACRVSGRP